MSGSLGAHLRSELLELYGPLIGGEDLMRAAGFQTTNALKLAVRHGRVGFDVFQITGRRGQFARTCDVAEWLNSIGRATHTKAPDAECSGRVSQLARKPSRQTRT
jgi:hypothetical protein